jgi:hypothetical protein
MHSSVRVRGGLLLLCAQLFCQTEAAQKEEERARAVAGKLSHGGFSLQAREMD